MVQHRAGSSEPVVRDPDAILDGLSLSEKVGQLVGTWIGSMGEDVSLEDAKTMVREGNLGTVAAFGIGVSWFHDPERVAEVANEMQRTAVEETDHGIPLLLPVDGVHGHGYVDHAAVFPHGLGVAATRRPDLARTAGQVTATEMRATGANVNYAPTGDVVRDPRWGRTFETYGESPLLCSEFAAATVRGLESEADGERVAATIKHFPAYGDPTGGEDTGAVECDLATLYRDYLPPFEAAIDAGVSLVMPCYNAVNGEPAHGSEFILTELLRERLGFDGAVVSDWGGVDHLHEDHRVTRDQRDSARRAIDAGLDSISIGRDEHAAHLHDLVESGELPEERIDEAVRRILELKIDLGLFEDPYVDPGAASKIVGAPDHRDAVLEAARESQTLLKNDDLLPLDSDLEEVLVTGPNADSLRNQLGGWSVQQPKPDAGTTLLEGVEAATSDRTTVRYERGAGIDEPDDVDAAVDAAADADVAVVALGENWYYHEFGPQEVAGETGSFPTRTELGLPDAQRELLERVHETGTPTVLVLITGRPLAIEWAAEEIPAILMSYYPGSEGGTAIAETLFGTNNPSGRLPITVPRSVGHLPSHFDQLAHPTPIGDDEHPDSYDPLFEFGHGLSYTEFDVSDLETTNATIGPGEPVDVTVTVENVGDRAGARALDVFLRDDVSSRVRPVREHVAFATVDLEAGESTTVELTIPNDALAVTGPNGRRTVEPGTFTLFCDGCSTTVEVDSEY
ncbi:glycoside hydrolase family 3 N-terminal domain-containing protein [Natronobacterium texcoconense]|uniref:beta-glucosidase n=1 Tax=Natronobacterium texcoconense TaxID=1095778 RepID=A0A1H1FRN2_NATTX|nr:glycoside hydrolase family 3 N-terminal domain-containing protein [Natronobacterium texcoconense]SDR03597.1 beta-glucosidase [Natronobacterium texcoconense]